MFILVTPGITCLFVNKYKFTNYLEEKEKCNLYIDKYD